MQFLKKLKHYLTVWDGIWSIPLFIAIFYFVGTIGQFVFGYTVGFYDPSIWQAVFLSIGIVITFNCATLFILWFYFRSVFRYFIGQKSTGGVVKNQSKIDGKDITTWQRLKVSFFVYFFQLVLFVVVLSLLIK